MKQLKVAMWLSVQLLCFTVFAQNGTINGLVTDAQNGDPLPFVNISTTVEGNLIGGQTDFDGNYTLEVPQGTHEIKFSYTGYEAQLITQYIGSGETITLNVELGTSSTLLQTVVISEGKYEKPISKVTVSMEVLKPSTLSNANDTQVDQAIERVPGVDVVDGQANIRGGSGYSYGAGSRVMLLMDGLPVLTADAGFPNWDFLPIENVSQIEIIKGAASALYGSSAMNGIINLRTGYPTSEPETKISAFTGIWQNPRNSEVDIFNGDGVALPDTSAQKNWWKGRYPAEAGFSIAHKQKFDKLDLVLGSYLYTRESWRQEQFSRRGRVSANLRYRPDIEGLSFGVNTNFMLNTSVSFLIWDYNPDSASDSYNPVGMYQLWRATPPINNNGTKLTIDPFIEYFTQSGWRFKALGRYFKNDNINDTNQSTKSDFYYGELQTQKRIEEAKFSATLGLVGSLSKADAELYDGIFDATNLAAYIQFDKEFWDNLNVSVGARYERNTIDDGSGELDDVDAKPVFRAGVNYQPFEATYLRASYGQAYRFPTIAEKFVQTNLGAVNVANLIDVNVGIFPNPNLEPETGWSAELGLKQGFKISDWQGFVDLTGFINEYQNMMEFSFGTNPALEPLLVLAYPDWDYETAVELSDSGAVGFQSINIGNTRIMGGDFTLAGQGELFGAPTRALMGYTYTLPRHQNFDTLQQKLSSVDYNILKYRFRHTFKLDAETKLRKITLGSSLRYYSFMEAVDESFNWILPGVRQWREDNNTGSLIWDARIRYNFNDKTTLAFISKNVLNNEYSLRPALIDAPRSFVIKFAHQL